MGRPILPAVIQLLLKPMASRYVRRDVASAPDRGAPLPEYLTPCYAALPDLAMARSATKPECHIADDAQRRRFQLIFSAMSARSIEVLERHHARHGIDHVDPWSDRRLAEYVVSIPQHVVHRFGDVKRIVRGALGPILPEHHRRQIDNTVKPDATALFDRGLLDRSRVAMEGLIQDSVAAELGFVDKSVLWDDYQGLLAGRPDHYDIWWFVTMEMWLQTHWK